MKRSLLLADSLRDRLSDYAVGILTTLDIRRDPDWTAPRDTLRAILENRGVGAPPAVLDIEEAVAGAELNPGQYVGVFAAIRSRERRPPLRKTEHAYVSGEGIRLQPKAFLRYEDKTLYPLSAGQDPEWSAGEKGRVYFENRDDDYGYTSPAFDSIDQLIETVALMEHPLFPPEEGRLFQHYVRLDAPCCAQMASLLGAEPFDAATGEHSTAWRSDDLWILERRFRGFAEDTLIGTASAEIALQAVREGLKGCSKDIEWKSPLQGALPAPEANGLPRFTREAKNGRERHVWGSPRAYDFDFKRAHATGLRAAAGSST